MTAGTEPELRSGDSGESVTALQMRLQALGLYDGSPDGSFGDQTQAAVAQLQEHGGAPANGEVDALVWDLLSRAEEAAGLHDSVAQHLDGATGAAAGTDSAATPVGTLSEDQHWRWDGDGWQPNEDRGQVDSYGDEPGGGQVSADGQWLWDGNQWQPVPK